MNTVDALKDLYKTLCGKDYAGDPNPTDAEMISAIAKDASSGGGTGEGSIPELVFTAFYYTNPSDETYTVVRYCTEGKTREDIVSFINSGPGPIRIKLIIPPEVADYFGIADTDEPVEQYLNSFYSISIGGNNRIYVNGITADWNYQQSYGNVSYTGYSEYEEGDNGLCFMNVQE